ncbi:SRPBCC family protein [Chryseobacterium sp. NFX27]|uniref:SRPBCC family protein n=1 Tax=Chryseobacterium sp. NFX27 TaxID=2819618 RepID=UPI003CF6B78D
MNTPITVQYKINTPVEKVWKALTDTNEMKAWYFDIPDFTLEEGEIFNFYEPGEEKKYHHQCQILEIVPNKKLKHTWSYPELSDVVTTVTWELEKEDIGTLITLTHDHIEGFDGLGENFSLKSFTEGWNGIIGGSLKEYLEK